MCSSDLEMPYFAALGAYIIAYIRVLVPNGVYLTTNFLRALSFAPSSCPASSETFRGVFLYSAVGENLYCDIVLFGGWDSRVGWDGRDSREFPIPRCSQ